MSHIPLRLIDPVAEAVAEAEAGDSARRDALTGAGRDARRTAAAPATPATPALTGRRPPPPRQRQF